MILYIVIYILAGICYLLNTIPTKTWEVVLIDEYFNQNRTVIRMKVPMLWSEDEVLAKAKSLSEFPFQPYKANKI